MVRLFFLVPFLALGAAVPFAWVWGLNGLDGGLAVLFYFFALAGSAVRFHRYFIHWSFQANRPRWVTLAIIGSMALQGPVIA